MMQGGKRVAKAAPCIPKVSIISVVLNAALLVEELLLNVAPYLSDEIELILIDGGSTDGTLALFEKNNHLIGYWRSEPDGGIYDAMNKATKYARGKWLYFMGADDRLLGGFAKAIKLLSKPETVYYGKVVLWGEIVGKPYTRYDFTKVEICHQSIFYPASVFKNYRYDIRYKVSADHYLNIQCFTDKRYKWRFVDELMAIYDTRGFSASILDNAFRANYNAIVKSHLGWWVYIRYLFRTVKQKRRLK